MNQGKLIILDSRPNQEFLSPLSLSLSLSLYIYIYNLLLYSRNYSFRDLSQLKEKNVCLFLLFLLIIFSA